jgi:GDPmannose 4,6-dehydratase
MVAMAFACAGLDWQEHVTIRQDLMRPAEVDVLLGDATKARERLGWTPSVTLEEMLAEMVDADLARHRARQQARQKGDIPTLRGHSVSSIQRGDDRGWTAAK